ncbi:MAG: calcium-binding protein [Pseudodonghicola sp.]|nr:calcium-binding protein [Pseudodonghicola sp.]
MVVWTQLVVDILPIAGVDDTNGTAVLGRIFGANGKPSGEVFQINEKTEGGQGKIDLTLLKDGNVVVAWTDGPGIKDFDIDARAAIVSPKGKIVVTEFELAKSTTGEQQLPQVDALKDGGFQAAWLDEQEGYGDRWFTQAFDAKGKRVGPELPLDTDGGEDANLIALGNGVKILTGSMWNTDIFAWSGTKTEQPYPTLDYKVLANRDIHTIPGEGHTGFESDAAAAGDSRFAVIRQDASGVKLSFFEVDPDGSFDKVDVAPFDVAAPTYASRGNDVTLWDFYTDNPSGYASVPTYFRPFTELVELKGGNLLALWSVVTEGDSDATARFSIYAQAFSGEGTPLGERQEVESNLKPSAAIGINWPFAAQGKNGDIFLGYTVETDRNGEGTREIGGGVYRLTLPKPDMKSSKGDDTLYGSSKGDKISGGPGDDVVFGFGGDDVIDFSTGGERIFGGAGNDRFVTESLKDFQGAGAVIPVIDGGDGTDLLDLRGLPYGADLGQSWLYIRDGYGSGKLRNIEQVVMTDYDDKAFIGNNRYGLQLEKVWLMGGDDTAHATSGTYQIDGGKGFDSVDFYLNKEDMDVTKVGKAKYVVTYEDPTGADYNFKVTLTKVELLKFIDGTEMKLGATKGLKVPNEVDFGGLPGKDGNGGNNTLIGTGKDERFDAGGGNDTVRAKGGADQLLGGAGKDKLFGDDGDDFILGGAGNDKLYGGDGSDTLDGGAGNDVIRGDAGDDELIGGAGNDKLFAGNGSITGDTLIGGAGNDTMTAGDGRDTFEFSTGMGKDKILKFDAVATAKNGYSADMLQFEYRAFDPDIYDGKSFVDKYASVEGKNIVFDLPGKDSLTLVGVTDLDAVAQTVFLY